jgi:plasmid stability protein
VAQVIVRNLDEAVVARHRERARARGVSLEQELRDVLARGARLRPEERLAEIERAQALTPAPPRGAEPVPGWVLIREERDTR